ncbi:hypothetical protein [Marinimicrobium sp. ABcell2]|uniref:hypothetical protein n=1 Tax=Marinimicrobium sp. ABcell2 TaxID=3069751 RepID=UPI0027B018FE|nr:hypothetical protein [Marinimicrobium sp. ABcell2]MDQ2077632.1 hypothetical protein [Marinimicrobium sp. ABcell2]
MTDFDPIISQGIGGSYKWRVARIVSWCYRNRASDSLPILVSMADAVIDATEDEESWLSLIEDYSPPDAKEGAFEDVRNTLQAEYSSNPKDTLGAFLAGMDGLLVVCEEVASVYTGILDGETHPQAEEFLDLHAMIAAAFLTGYAKELGSTQRGHLSRLRGYVSPLLSTVRDPLYHPLNTNRLFLLPPFWAEGMHIRFKHGEATKKLFP